MTCDREGSMTRGPGKKGKGQLLRREQYLRRPSTRKGGEGGTAKRTHSLSEKEFPKKPSVEGPAKHTKVRSQPRRRKGVEGEAG